MLRLNLLQDEGFRNDILKLVRNALKEAVPKAIAEKFAEDGWLDERFDAALMRLDLPKRLADFLRTRDLWESRFVREAIEAIASAKCENIVAQRAQSLEKTLVAHGQKVIDDFAKKIRAEEGFIRQVVAEELRKRLAGS